MKKIFLAVLAIVGVCNTTSAQYTPQKNDISAEILFNPFKSGNSPIFSLNDDYAFKVRWMFTDKDALRFKVGLSIDNNTTTLEEEDGMNKTDLSNCRYKRSTTETKNKYTSFSINAGYERHFPVSQRIDLYAGGEIGYRIESRSGEETVTERNENYDGSGKLSSYYDIRDFKEYTNKDADGKAATNRFTVAAFSGFDFYVYKGLYLGAELGIKFATGKSPKQGYYTQSYSKVGESDVANRTIYSLNYDKSTETGVKTGTKTEGTTVTAINEIEGKELSETSETKLKFYVEPNIRLGIKF